MRVLSSVRVYLGLGLEVRIWAASAHGARCLLVVVVVTISGAHGVTAAAFGAILSGFFEDAPVSSARKQRTRVSS